MGSIILLRVSQTSIQLLVTNHQAASRGALFGRASIVIGVAPILSEGAERGDTSRSRVRSVAEKVWRLSFDTSILSLHPVARTKMSSAAASAASIRFAAITSDLFSVAGDL
jgi:hypothetical protein